MNLELIIKEGLKVLQQEFFSEGQEQDFRVKDVFKKQMASRPPPSPPLDLSVERKFEILISEIPFPSEEEVYSKVFNQEVDKEVTLEAAERDIVKDLRRGAVIRLNQKEYTRTSHIREARDSIIAELPKPISEKIVIGSRLSAFLENFHGDQEKLKRDLSEFFPVLTDEERGKLKCIILDSASKTAVSSLKKYLLNILFPSVQDLNNDQKEDLKKVFLQCFQSAQQPLVAHYMGALGGLDDGNLAGISIKGPNDQIPILTFANPSDSNAARYHIRTSLDGLTIKATCPLRSSAYDGNELFPVADYEGVVESQFTHEGDRILPKAARLAIALTQIHFNELRERGAKLQMPEE